MHNDIILSLAYMSALYGLIRSHSVSLLYVEPLYSVHGGGECDLFGQYMIRISLLRVAVCRVVSCGGLSRNCSAGGVHRCNLI